MGKYLTAVLISMLTTQVSISQTDKRLEERLDSMLEMTKASDFPRILDFTYPKLFTIVPREEMMKALEESLKGDEFTTSFDSIQAVRVYPVFTEGKGSYARITHTLRMNLRFKDPLDTMEISGSNLLNMVREDYGPGNVFFDKPTNTIRIGMLSDMIAIRDEYAPEWSFVNFNEKDQELCSLLFTDQVLKKLRTFQ